MMRTIRIAVICPSEIAFRRFMPAINKMDGVQYIGVGINSVSERYGDSLPSEDERQKMLSNERTRAEDFEKNFGGCIFDSYESVISSDLIDAVYIPLPPALHFKWARLALLRGKHILVEKPSTVTSSDARELVRIAREKNLALHENYMFIYHNQLEEINRIIKSGEIGDVRLYRVRFGFPRRASDDFRYVKALGGGALIDAGGYTIKYAALLLGDTARIRYAQMNYLDGFEVDMYGSAALSNANGQVAHISFGMDNDYKCELEVWGSKGTLIAGRVLTAPAGFTPNVTIIKNGDTKTKELSADDAFKKSIEKFLGCVFDDNARQESYMQIQKQADLVDEFREMAE